MNRQYLIIYSNHLRAALQTIFLADSEHIFEGCEKYQIRWQRLTDLRSPIQTWINIVYTPTSQHVELTPYNCGLRRLADQAAFFDDEGEIDFLRRGLERTERAKGSVDFRHEIERRLSVRTTSHATHELNVYYARITSL